ncbi:MAG TPA: ATP-binding protein [Novosphingobium sp.]|nr:ATP-binding protein [Novosphingobium sp.]
MNMMRSWSLVSRLLTILALVLALDFLANTLLFEKAGEFALEDEEASALAERLAVASHVLSSAPPPARDMMARRLSSANLDMHWSASGQRPVASISLARLQAQLIAAQPELAHAQLQLQLMPMRLSKDMGGSLVLTDGTLLTFHHHVRAAWALKAGNLVVLLLPTVALLGVTWVLVFATLRPLRQLVRASAKVGTHHARPLDEAGPPEMRQLIRAFNAMQTRIDDLLDTNTQTMLAIGHDLRTPLSRLQLRLDGIGLEADERGAMEDDIAEVRDLIASVQSYVDAGSVEARQQRVDLAAMAETLVDNATDHGQSAEYVGPDSLVIMARPVPLRRALSNLVNNALHYAGNARVVLEREGGWVRIAVEDDGPGIPEDSMAKVLQPFVRLDASRQRDTRGMGLGLAIVVRIIEAEGGSFALSNRSQGGLCAVVRLPIGTA